MPTSKFTKTDKAIILGIFGLYMLGYHFLMSSGSGQPEYRAKNDVAAVSQQKQRIVSEPPAQKRAVKSLSDWPLDLGKYFYWIDIAPGYEMEGEEYEVVGESGGNLIVKKHNDWPDISGHFEWYCNEKLTTTQQMFDYVVAHRQAIIRQMQEVKRRGLSHPQDEASYYQDHYDEYQDDPEDELRFPPEIFDANDD